MPTNSIQFIMLKDHNRLDKYLSVLTDEIGIDDKEYIFLFKKFKIATERHFQIEEQAIFSFSHLGGNESQKSIRMLLSEHGRIRELLKEMDNEIVAGNAIDFKELSKLLLKHQAIENEVLYPKLDNELTEKEKEYILQKIIKLQIKN